MASRISLPFWPSSLDCLTWSSDNLIAVGGGDQIGILTPRLQGPGPNGTHWNSTYFRANAFTVAEAPLLHPLTFGNFSVGEELSQRHVHALEWSPPGLARFGQCVLGVLSSNHALSLWECEGRSDVGGNWRRSVIVNHALISHYSTIERRTNEAEQLFNERKQVSQRVRGFAWSPRIKASGSRDGSFMAVSTEAGDILVLHLRPPYDILKPDRTEWEMEIMRIFKVKDLVKESGAESLGDSTDVGTQKEDHPIADHIASGPWHTLTDTISSSSISFITNGRLFAFQLQVDSKSHSHFEVLRQTQTTHLLTSRSDLIGPLRYISRADDLTLFAPDAVYCVGTSSPADEDSSTSFHCLDGRWDEVSGVSVCRNGGKPPEIHIVSHLSSSKAATTSLPTPLHPTALSAKPKWQDAINKSKTAFSDQHDLAGNVQERTWGIASSPVGEYVATAITLLPSDSVAHIIPSDRNTIIHVTQEVPFSNEDVLQMDNENGIVSSETKLFQLQRYLGESPQMAELQNLVAATIPDADAGDIGERSEDVSAILAGSNASQIAAWLRNKTFDRSEMAWERKISLTSMALGTTSDGARRSPNIIHRVVAEVLRLREFFDQGGEFSDRIRNVHRILSSKLNAPPQSSEEQMDNALSSEACRICEEPIFFESVKWSRCRGGHQFSRCGLTFLSIQEPGFSKHCGVCGVQVLNEWKVPGLTSATKRHDSGASTGMMNSVEITDGDVEDMEPKTSLARILFAALDVCIYCGGKFIT